MITAITPTCDRPAGIAHCERWMARQTVKPDRWIVADGGMTQARLTMGQKARWSPGESGAANFAGNVLRALEGVTGAVVIIEDDDWYAPDHIARCVAGLEKVAAYGCPLLRYWNLNFRSYMEARNDGASLAQTATLDVLALRTAAEAALAAGDYTIDGRFWRGRVSNAPPSSVGIKGLEGTKGLGVGHRAGKRWRRDPAMAKLRQWIGDDVRFYGA